MNRRAIAAVGVALAVACLPVAARADGFSLTATDKQAHIAASYALALTGTVILRHWDVPRWKALVASSAAALAIGTFKELLVDDHPSWGDELADGIGVGGAVVVSLSFKL